MKPWRVVAALILTAVLAVSGWQLWRINETYKQQSEMYEEALRYKPSDAQGENPQVTKLQEMNRDVVGWLSISGTQVEYPFVQTNDNETYLRHDLHGKSATAGTIFMDYRCAPDFSGKNTILYGHNMRNGSMFHAIVSFGDEEFFNQHPTGEIYLASRKLKLEFFACAVVKAADSVTYSLPRSGEQQRALLQSLERQAKQFRDIGVTQTDQIVLLSTCSYQFDGARTVLAARIINL